jgi:hypothetical protein
VCRDLTDRSSKAVGQEFAKEALSDSYINVTEGEAIGVITIEDVIEARLRPARPLRLRVFLDGRVGMPTSMTRSGQGCVSSPASCTDCALQLCVQNFDLALMMRACAQELIGDEIVDETDRWISNEQATSVQGSHMHENLPENLQTLLKLGVFMPSGGRPARGRKTTTSVKGEAPAAPPPLPERAAQACRSDSDASTLPNARAAGHTRTVSRNGTDGRATAGELPTSWGRGESGQRTASLNDDQVSEAARRVEAAIAADAGVRDALDVLQRAAGSSVAGGSSHGSSRVTSFIQSRHARRRNQT